MIKLKNNLSLKVTTIWPFIVLLHIRKGTKDVNFYSSLHMHLFCSWKIQMQRKYIFLMSFSFNRNPFRRILGVLFCNKNTIKKIIDNKVFCWIVIILDVRHNGANSFNWFSSNFTFGIRTFICKSPNILKVIKQISYEAKTACQY